MLHCISSLATRFLLGCVQKKYKAAEWLAQTSSVFAEVCVSVLCLLILDSYVAVASGWYCCRLPPATAGQTVEG